MGATVANVEMVLAAAARATEPLAILMAGGFEAIGVLGFATLAAAFQVVLRGFAYRANVRSRAPSAPAR